MATQLKIETSITLVESNPPSSLRLLSNTSIVDCTSREYGVKNLPANTLNVEIASDVEYIHIISPQLITIQVNNHSIGSTIGTFISKQFSYENTDTSIDVIISNTNPDTIDVEYVTATIS